MMKLRLLQVDAFTSRVFGGNPAGVVPLETWLPAATMQAIAAENNVAETAFVVPADAGQGRRDREAPDAVGRSGEYDFGLRWFTPAVEMDLCGHATLAAAHVLWRHLGLAGETVRFDSRSGPLRVDRAGARLVLDFPARPATPRPVPESLARALGAAPRELHVARDWMAVFGSEAEVRALRPHSARVAELDTFAVIATAPGDACDFVSRFFAPRAGIDEDPVTGSAHCTLIPYWSQRLGKPELFARQVSPRGGELYCRDNGERVAIGGEAVTYLDGFIEV